MWVLSLGLSEVSRNMHSGYHGTRRFCGIKGSAIYSDCPYVLELTFLAIEYIQSPGSKQYAPVPCYLVFETLNVPSMKIMIKIAPVALY